MSIQRKIWTRYWKYHRKVVTGKHRSVKHRKFSSAQRRHGKWLGIQLIESMTISRGCKIAF